MLLRVRSSLGMVALTLCAAGGCGTKFDAVQLADAGCPDAGRVTYVDQIDELVTMNCTDCHRSTLSGAERNGAPADRNYDSFAGISEVASLANTRVQNGSMPPGSRQLEVCEKALFASWVAEGAPEQ